ncbi:phospho-sugar mutase [Oceanobacillus sp. CAU 1775]
MGRSWRQTYEQWAGYPDLNHALKEELDILKIDEKNLEDAFYQELTFGTGGIRGLLGPGTNRMNIYTVRKAVHGLAHYLLENEVNVKHRGVVIAYDSRYMSKEFSIEAAQVLGAHGIRSYVFQTIKPTPLLSFAVRHLSAVAGIMVTASHNPPEYNGLKVYNETGGQIVQEEALQIIQAIKQIDNELFVPISTQAELEDAGDLIWLDEAIDLAYLEQLHGITKLSEEEQKKEKDLKIVYTPLHGTGTSLVSQGFERINFPNVTLVEEQLTEDPEFSTVESPNPEEHQAFNLAIAYGEKINADLLLATDPDADRLGAAVRDENGNYIVLTGNQLGSLLLDYILIHTDLHIYRNPRMIKTVVTTELGREIASSYGVETIETLTGFKYISEKISTFGSTGETFVFGFEESYGYLINDFSRDKDAVQAAVLTAEMAYYWKNKGKTVFQALEDLYEKHGYYLEGLNHLQLEGRAGQSQTAHIMEGIRKHSPSEIADLKVEKIEDYLTSESLLVETKETEQLHLPKENMVKFILADDSWVSFRPSGTEPKLKYYYGVKGTSKADSIDRINELKTALEQIVADLLETY